MKLRNGICAALSAALLTACGGGTAPQTDGTAPQTEESQKVQLVVFAAASLQETLTEIGDLYRADHPEVAFLMNFDSSGTLKTQIQEGAPCDLFLSAAPKQMDQLDLSAGKEANPDGLDFVDPGTRLDLLENHVVLAVPDGNPAGVDSFDTFARKLAAGELLLAMGNGDVPAGQYAQRILAYYNLNEEAVASAGHITYGSNVKEVAAQVTEGAVDCGIIYSTDAYSANLTVADSATEEMCGRVIYPAAVLKTAERPEEAQAFLDFLSTEPAMAVFASVGFAPAG